MKLKTIKYILKCEGDIDLSNLTATTILEYQNKFQNITTRAQWQALRRELRETYGVSDIDAINLLNNYDVLGTLAKYEEANKNV